jgi:hypothetical protein
MFDPQNISDQKGQARWAEGGVRGRGAEALGVGPVAVVARNRARQLVGGRTAGRRALILPASAEWRERV